MMVVVSPAKRLDFESDCKILDKETTPSFLDTTHKLIKDLKKLKTSDIQDLMKLSPKLSELNFARFQSFKQTPSDLSRPSAWAFKGDTYMGLEFEKLTAKEQDYAQDHLRILSGLYGLLRPLDGIQPYRLEMGTPIKTTLGKNLYEVWQEKVTEELNFRLQKNDFLVNCASVEYFSAVNTKKLNAKIITPVFMEMKNGKAKIISFNAKRARGMMAKYIIQTKAKTIEDLKRFDLADYKFQKDSSTDTELIFLRG